MWRNSSAVCGLPSRLEHAGRGPQSGDRPKIVPIVIVVGSQVLGTEAGRQQPGVGLVELIGQQLLLNPLAAARDRRLPVLRRRLARQLAVAIEDPQRLAVGVPFAFLREEVPRVRLPGPEALDRPADPRVQAHGQHGVQDEGRIAEPEPLVGVGAGIDIVRRVQHQRPQRGIVEELHPLVGDVQLRMALQGRLPARLVATVSRSVGCDSAAGPAACGRQSAAADPAVSANIAAAVAMPTSQRTLPRPRCRAASRAKTSPSRYVGELVPIARRAETHMAIGIDAPAGIVAGELDVVDEAHALGVVGPQGHDQPGRHIGPAAQLLHAGRPRLLRRRRRPGSSRPVRRRSSRYRRPGARHRSTPDAARASWQRAGTSVLVRSPSRSSHRATSRPRTGVISPRGSTIGRWSQSGRPTAVQLRCVRLTWVIEKARGMKDTSSRIELAIDPIGPDPVEVVLDGPGVHQPPGMEHDTCAQQLQRRGHFRRLREAVQVRQHGDRDRRNPARGPRAARHISREAS